MSDFPLVSPQSTPLIRYLLTYNETPLFLLLLIGCREDTEPDEFWSEDAGCVFRTICVPSGHPPADALRRMPGGEELATNIAVKHPAPMIPNEFMVFVDPAHVV